MNASSLVVCSSRLRAPGPEAAESLARLAAQAQADGGFLTGPWTCASVGHLAAALAAEGLPLVGLTVPLPKEALPAGKRLPYWASPEDAEERLAALELADQAMGPANATGAGWALLSPCKLNLKTPSALLVRAFAEARWEPDGSPSPAVQPLLEAARAERKPLEGKLADAARFSLERLARLAERHRLKLAVAHGVGPWQYPSPRELDLLLAEFEGALLCRAHLPARLDVLEILGMLTPERREALSRAPFVWATEAVGLLDDLLAGLGPNPLRAPLRQAHGDPPELVVVSGQPDSHAHEVKDAVASLRTLSLRSSAS